MPFESEAQRRYLWAKHPDIARRWAKEYPGQKNLPRHVRKMSGGGLAELIQYLKKTAPSTGLRLEKAADLVPNIDKLYSPETLAQAAMAGELAVYRPEKFESLAMPIHPYSRNPDRSATQSAENIKSLRRLIRSGEQFNTIPFLNVDAPAPIHPPSQYYFGDESPNMPRVQYPLFSIPRIVGHEGRHRSRALAQEDIPLSVLRMSMHRLGPLKFSSLSDAVKPEASWMPPLPIGNVLKEVPFSGGGLAQAMRSLIASGEHEPLKIARQYALEKLGRNYSTDLSNFAPSSLRKQSSIGSTFEEGAKGSLDYKSAVMEGFFNRKPFLLHKEGIKDYDSLLERAYNALGSEVEDQFSRLPIKVNWHEGGKDYRNSSDMLVDALLNKNLSVFTGGDDHQFLTRGQNDKFRAVHDYFGHGIHGNSFGPKGEEVAWLAHKRMMSPLAQIAMSAETRGQNSMVNYTPMNVDNIRKMIGVRREMEQAKRLGLPTKDFEDELFNIGRGWNYAPQAGVALPPEMLTESYRGDMPEYIRRLMKGSGRYNINEDPERLLDLAKVRSEGNPLVDAARMARERGYEGLDYAGGGPVMSKRGLLLGALGALGLGVKKSIPLADRLLPAERLAPEVKAMRLSPRPEVSMEAIRERFGEPKSMTLDEIYDHLKNNPNQGFKRGGLAYA